MIQGEDSDAEDYFIRPNDNLLVTAHIEDDTSSLEVYGKSTLSLFFIQDILTRHVFLVYNDKEGYLYVHHDILMLNMPLCLTWLDYDANNDNAGLNCYDRTIEMVIFFVCFANSELCGCRKYGRHD